MTPNKALENYIAEAEEFFILKFIDSKRIKRIIAESITVIFNLENEPVKKGLFVFSKNVGQGKTMFFDIIAHRSKRIHEKKLWNKVTAVELCDLYATGGKEALNEKISIRNLVIDDLGKDHTSTRHFGDEINVLEYVIAKRYIFWIEKEFITHFTSNKSIDEIEAYYGIYIKDRIEQMCVIKEFNFNQGSFRQSTESRPLNKNEKKCKSQQ